MELVKHNSFPRIFYPFAVKRRTCYEVSEHIKLFRSDKLGFRPSVESFDLAVCTVATACVMLKVFVDKRFFNICGFLKIFVGC